MSYQHNLQEIINKKETDNSVLMKFKDATIAFLKQENLIANSNLSYDDNEDRITDFIGYYIRNTLTKKDIDCIICDYGISKAMKLFHDYHKIGLDSADIEICEILTIEDYGIEREIVELIINDEIGHNNNWRIEGDGRYNTYAQIQSTLIHNI